jgi:hypothetical protein
VARDYKKEYERRIKNAAKKGVSKQKARGHKKGEHKVRKEREIEERGISSQQEKTLVGWYERTYNPKGYPDAARADLDEVLEYARSSGYEAFKQWRDTWDAVRRTYIQEQLDGSYASRGEVYLQWMSAESGVSDVSWLYYH